MNIIKHVTTLIDHSHSTTSQSSRTCVPIWKLQHSWVLVCSDVSQNLTESKQEVWHDTLVSCYNAKLLSYYYDSSSCPPITVTPFVTLALATAIFHYVLIINSMRTVTKRELWQAVFAIVTVVRLPVSGILHCTSFIAGDHSLAVLSSN